MDLFRSSRTTAGNGVFVSKEFKFKDRAIEWLVSANNGGQAEMFEALTTRSACSKAYGFSEKRNKTYVETK